jgi:hypothetical protein
MYGVTCERITRRKALRLGLLVGVKKEARKQGFGIDTAITDTALLAVEPYLTTCVEEAFRAAWNTVHSVAHFRCQGARLKTVMRCEHLGEAPTLTIMLADEQ